MLHFSNTNTLQYNYISNINIIYKHNGFLKKIKDIPLQIFKIIKITKGC